MEHRTPTSNSARGRTSRRVGYSARYADSARPPVGELFTRPVVGLAAVLVLAPFAALACTPDAAPAWSTETAVVARPDASVGACDPARVDHAHAAPPRLADTGLYADIETKTVRADVLAYTPQYPLWSDGATKRRWIRLPAGTAIDGTNPDLWSFPVGTQVWKEFSFGRRVETRYLERAADGAWLYATYVWNADESDATLAPDEGVRAPRGAALRHDVPSAADCRACHEGSPVPVLGFGALQLASARDPIAPHAETPEPGSVDLDALVERGLLRVDAELLQDGGPRIAARTPRERAALGYLHANCGGCHNAQGPLAGLGLELDARVAERAHAAPALRTALERESRLRRPDDAVHLRIAGGAPEASLLVERMSSRFGALQMPPLGTHAVDEDALALVTDWIRNELGEPRTVAEPRAHERHR